MDSELTELNGLDVVREKGRREQNSVILSKDMVIHMRNNALDKIYTAAEAPKKEKEKLKEMESVWKGVSEWEFGNWLLSHVSGAIHHTQVNEFWVFS